MKTTVKYAILVISCLMDFVTSVQTLVKHAQVKTTAFCAKKIVCFQMELVLFQLRNANVPTTFKDALSVMMDTI